MTETYSRHLQRLNCLYSEVNLIYNIFKESEFNKDYHKTHSINLLLRILYILVYIKLIFNNKFKENIFNLEKNKY